MPAFIILQDIKGESRNRADEDDDFYQAENLFFGEGGSSTSPFEVLFDEETQGVLIGLLLPAVQKFAGTEDRTGPGDPGWDGCGSTGEPMDFLF